MSVLSRLNRTFNVLHPVALREFRAIEPPGARPLQNEVQRRPNFRSGSAIPRRRVGQFVGGPTAPMRVLRWYRWWIRVESRNNPATNRPHTAAGSRLNG